MKKGRQRSALAALLAFGLFLAACSSGEPTETTEAPGDTTATTEATTETTAAPTTETTEAAAAGEAAGPGSPVARVKPKTSNSWALPGTPGLSWVNTCPPTTVSPSYTTAVAANIVA